MKEALLISEVLQSLHQRGYQIDFRAEKGGLKACDHNIIIAPEDLVVDRIYRFEGETDLNEEAIIFALSSPKENLKGTYLIAFGSMMDPLDLEMVRRLENKV